MFKCVLLLAILIEANAKYMKLDKSKHDKWKCNDYLDKLWLNINYLNQTELLNTDRFILSYSYTPCFNTTHDDATGDYKCGAPKHLTHFNSSKKLIRIVLNSFYKYKIKISAKLMLPTTTTNTSEIALNDTLSLNDTHNLIKGNKSKDERQHEQVVDVCKGFDYIKFGNCDQYVLNIYDINNCSIVLIQPTPSSYPVKYIYLVIAIVFVIVVVVKISRVLFSKYRIVK